MSDGKEALTKDGAVSKNIELTRKLPVVDAEIIMSKKVAYDPESKTNIHGLYSNINM